MSTVTLHIGDVHERLAHIPDGSVDLFCTSPPFLAVRSYLPADHPDKALEIGSEATPAAFLDTLLALTAEWRRVLAPHGSLCVELGDTYSGSGGAGGDYGPDGLRDGQPTFKQTNPGRTARYERPGGHPMGPISARARQDEIAKCGPGWPLAKSLTGIPTLYAWSLAYGYNLLRGPDHPSPAGQWRIRNLLVWARPNPPVGALGDKFRPATSYITVATTAARRWFDLDAVRTAHKDEHDVMRERLIRTGGAARGELNGRMSTGGDPAGAPPLDWHQDGDDGPGDDGPTGDRLWVMPTQPYRGAHYATYPTELPRRLIEAMCPRQVCRVCGKARERIVDKTDRYEAFRADRLSRIANGATTTRDKAITPTGFTNSGTAMDAEYVTLGWSDCGHDNYRPGMVLDPFAGSGTTLAVAAGLGRDAIGIDLDARNTGLVDRRLREHVHVIDRYGSDSMTTWHTEPPLPDQGDQIDGQTNLLDLLEAP